MQPDPVFAHQRVISVYPNTLRKQWVHISSLLAKRFIDIIFSAVLLFLSAPIIIVAAIAAKYEGQKGSIFYGGWRVGYGGEKFRCWKLRSMSEGNDYLLHDLLERDENARRIWQTHRKLPCDPRVTTYTGHFIRRCSIDELPQIWNVLIGDMSLVGPRPILPDEEHYFGDHLETYCSVRPGLTGPWQVMGRNRASFASRVECDLNYIRTWNFWRDMMILVKTPMAVIKHALKDSAEQNTQ